MSTVAHRHLLLMLDSGGQIHSLSEELSREQVGTCRWAGFCEATS